MKKHCVSSTLSHLNDGCEIPPPPLVLPTVYNPSALIHPTDASKFKIIDVDDFDKGEVYNENEVIIINDNENYNADTIVDDALESKSGHQNIDHQVMKTVESIYDEMQIYLESIPKAPQPSQLTTKLLPHQLQALEWLTNQESKSGYFGGILADDMGVGKTIETLSLICSRLESPTLIVGPVTTLSHWKSEIEKHVVENLLSTYLYHGNSRHCELNEMKSKGVVITSYGTLLNEFKWWNSCDTDIYDTSLLYEMPLDGKRSRALLYRIGWKRIVLDEAHIIKNKNSQINKAVCALKSKYRFCLTGTPIQNNIDDLYSLLKFLRFQNYQDYRVWKQSVVNPIVQKVSAGHQLLSDILKLILLRRTKNQKLFNKPIINLPSINFNVKILPLDKSESIFYQVIERSVLQKFNNLVEGGIKYLKSHYEYILFLLLRLRQTCCHPYLLIMSQTKLKSKTWDFCAIDEWFRDILNFMNLNKDKALDYHFENFFLKNNSKVCKVCSDSTNTIPLKCMHFVCESCITSAFESNFSCPVCHMKMSKNEIFDKNFNLKTNDTVDKCISSRSCSQSCDTYKTKDVCLDRKYKNSYIYDGLSHVADRVFTNKFEFQGESEHPVIYISEDEKASTDDTDCKVEKSVSLNHLSISSFNFGSQNGFADDLNTPIYVDENYERFSSLKDEQIFVCSNQDENYYNISKPINRIELSDQHLNEPMCCIDSLGNEASFQEEIKKYKTSSNVETNCIDSFDQVFKSRKITRDTKLPTSFKIMESTKLTALRTELEKIRYKKDKVIIYSQFVTYISIFENCINHWGWKSRRLDGSSSQKKRDDIIKSFRYDDSIRILIISLKAGGVGIDLTVANHVFIMDPWWNAAIEQQAIDRVYRIGQVKPINVTRFLIKDSIEERMLVIQETKRQISNHALSDSKCYDASKGISLQDLKLLFKKVDDKNANKFFH